MNQILLGLALIVLNFRGMLTKVHFYRTVLRIKNNHKYVPIDDQERFQSLMNILLRENMSEDEVTLLWVRLLLNFPIPIIG